MYETREQALTRLDELREMLNDPAADLAAIEQEIGEIEQYLATLAEAADEIAQEAGQSDETEQAEEDRADEEPEEEQPEEAQEAPGEPEEEDRTSQARMRAELRSRVTSGTLGAMIRRFNNMEGNRMERFALNSPEYRSAWLRNLQGKTLSVEERTAVTASAAIPTETMNKIWGKMELYPLLNAVDVMHVPGSVILPVEGTVNAAGVVAMGTAATDAADTLTPISLGVYKIIKTLEITADVEAMAVDAFEQWLVDRLANKIYRAVTGYIAAGTGTSQPTGLTTITATNQTYTKTGITYEDVMTIIASLPTEYDPNAAFVMSRANFYGNVLAIQDTNHNPIVVVDVQAPAKFNILGYPVIIEDGVGTDIIFGDLKEGYVWNFGKDVAIDRDESVGFRTGSVVFRGMCLGDGKPTGVGLVRYTKAT
ncbi:MAG: phage major capsid protein [Clostridia bacterium]|nr:phage major capsid protein [Clostridia bacterium]MBR0405545.1 phage major capsid protein [Eggerthellaceae bacterium]